MSGNRHPRLRTGWAPAVLPAILLAIPAMGLPWDGAGGGEARAGGLVDHRATYAMNMVRSSGQGGISGARGAMVYEFRDTCDGWQVDTKVYLRLRSGRGPEMESVRLVSSWEAKDGSGFRFRVTEKTGGEVSEEIRGSRSPARTAASPNIPGRNRSPSSCPRTPCFRPPISGA